MKKLITILALFVGTLIARPATPPTLSIKIIPDPDGNLIEVSFLAKKGGAYVLQHTDCLGSSNWFNLYYIEPASEDVLVKRYFPIYEKDVDFFRVVQYIDPVENVAINKTKTSFYEKSP